MAAIDSGRGDPLRQHPSRSSARSINLWITDLNVGALFLLAFGSVGVYGIILGGYASANRYSLLGGLRAAAQVISYEIILGLVAGRRLHDLVARSASATIMEDQHADL